MDIAWYAILGVSPDASVEEVRGAYNKLVLIHHPNHGGGDRQFVLIKEAYSRYLNAGSPPPVKVPPRPRLGRWLSPRLVLAGLTVLALCMGLIHASARPTIVRTMSSPAARCATGAPEVDVTNVQILPDDQLDSTADLYMVTGEITNTTTSVINVMGIGFYFGQADPNTTPAWTDETENMDLSGDITRIPVGGVIAWHEKQYVYNSPGTTDVGAALSFPQKIWIQTRLLIGLGHSKIRAVQIRMSLISRGSYGLGLFPRRTDRTLVFSF